MLKRKHDFAAKLSQNASDMAMSKITKANIFGAVFCFRMNERLKNCVDSSSNVVASPSDAFRLKKTELRNLDIWTSIVR